jgi:hypothetical protein
MNRIYTLISLATLSTLVMLTIPCRAQYLPTAGGTMTGPLTLNAGVQLQLPYLGFNVPFSQPAHSGNVAIFPNSTSASLDIIGWSNGWRFIPSNNNVYPTPAATIDPSGNTFLAGKLGIGTLNPLVKLHVNGSSLVGGNIDPANFNLSFLANTALLLTGWNRSAGKGEIDFIANQGAGGEGGFAFYNYSNSGIETQLMYIKGNGYVGIGTNNPQEQLSVNGKSVPNR